MMKFSHFIGLVVVLASLSACGPKKYLEDEQNFKPYVLDQQDTIPGYYPKETWSYPAGTPTREIVNRWHNAGLIMGAFARNDGVLEVTAGPQFYSLSQASQQGLSDAVAKMYGGKQFRLIDWQTKRVVGIYTAQGLQQY